AQRSRASFRVEADVGADSRQQRVAGDEDALMQEAEVTVGVSRQVDHLPAVDAIAGLERLGVWNVVDQGCERIALHAKRVRLLSGKAVFAHVLGEPLGGASRTPCAFALGEIDRSL